MKIIDRYILKSFLVNYAIALTVMIGIYVVLDLFVNLDEFTEVPNQTIGQILGRIADYYGHNLFLYFAQLAGVITLMAGCFTLVRLHRSNEMTAILAAGTSLYRVAAPLLIAGLAMNALWFVDQEFIIPSIAPKLARAHGDVEGRQTFAVHFLPDPENGNALLSASRFSPAVNVMRGVVILLRDDDLRLTEIIEADEANWDAEKGCWVFRNGVATVLAADPDDPTASVGRYAVREYRSDLTPREITLQQSAQWTQFLSLRELDRLQEFFAATGSGEFIRMKHSRLTTVFMNMTLLCIGLPFFLNRERPPIVVLGGKCLLAAGLCYASMFMMNTVDFSSVNVSPALPPWLPFIVFAPISVVMLEGIRT